MATARTLGRSTDWARQGVLMLNPVLTVEVGRAGAHMNCCWQALTGDVVRELADAARTAGVPAVGQARTGILRRALPAGRPAARAAAHATRRTTSSASSWRTAATFAATADESIGGDSIDGRGSASASWSHRPAARVG
jgi:hypothetical protein